MATLRNAKQGHGALGFPEAAGQSAFELAPSESVEVTDEHLAALRALDGVKSFVHEGALEIEESAELAPSEDESTDVPQGKPRRKGR